MKTIAEGTAYLFGNNIDTDQIYPGKYVELTEMEDIRKHAMSGSEEPDLATFSNRATSSWPEQISAAVPPASTRP